MTDFDQWWAKYPRKVGKLAAEKAYQKARTLATVDDLIDGIDRYLQMKPEYADFCHPTTWLTQGRWMDEPTPAEQLREEERPFRRGYRFR